MLHVARRKKGLSTTHLLRSDELRVIKAWLADRTTLKASCRAFFVSQHRRPLNWRTAWLAIRKYGVLAGLELPTHPHQLRHENQTGSGRPDPVCVAATTGCDFGGGREGFLPVRIPEDLDGGRRGRSRSISADALSPVPQQGAVISCGLGISDRADVQSRCWFRSDVLPAIRTALWSKH